MLTGRHPGTTGVLGNRTWFGDKHPEFVSLPKHFKNHGYTSIRVGKIFHGGIDDTEAWSLGGQQRFLAGVPKGELPRKTGGHKKAAGGPEAKPPLSKEQSSERRIVLEGNGENHADYRAADRVISYLRQFRDKQFFIGCGFLKPHTPLEAPQRFYDSWDVSNIPLPIDFASRPTVPEGFPAGGGQAAKRGFVCGARRISGGSPGNHPRLFGLGRIHGLECRAGDG